MNNIFSHFRINRLRVIGRGKLLYDQKFHEGVNIIRGQNGSGKSTISDFIFYILGGEYDDWKESARMSDEVQAEITTAKGLLTLKRAVGTKQTPISIFFGSMTDAETHGLEGWNVFPIRRQNGKESFSQVMFRSAGIPEAQSEGASNITMHQILRLCYSDQRTPATRLFRFESFDTHGIREAVGDLVCGVRGYEIYEIGLRIRDLTKELDGIRTRLFGLLKALPPDAALRTTQHIADQLQQLASEKARLMNEIANVDVLIKSVEIKEHLRARQQAQEKIARLQKDLEVVDSKVASLDMEIKEVQDFQIYIAESLEKLAYAEKSFGAIGSIEFTHCPACGEALNLDPEIGCCSLCGSKSDVEKEKSRYNKIRLDLEIQNRESKQLLASKLGDFELFSQSRRLLHKKYGDELSGFELKFSGANGPREAFLAARTSRVGYIDSDTSYLLQSLNLASEIDTLNSKKEDLESQLDRLKQREMVLNRKADGRRHKAYAEISNTASSILHEDLDRQEEFKSAQTVTLNFRDDAIFVDEKINFAESSNVFLKNTAILSMFLSSSDDHEFFHPRFLLLDNIEDKGMEVARSHLFQEIIVKRATEIKIPYQIIFTTSMMNPALDLDDYTIGPAYTKEQRTLALSR